MGPKILILEHDPNDIELIQYELKKSAGFQRSKFVKTEQEFKDALVEMQPDIILSDFNLPSFNGINAFKVKQSLLPEIPFIIVSGTIGEQRAADLIKMGVTDYVLKENLYQIPIKISRALQEAEERRQKREIETQLADQNEQIKNILESISDGFFSVNREYTVNYWNQQAEYLLGKNEKEILGKNLSDEFNCHFSDKFYAEFQKILDTGVPEVFEEFVHPLQIWLQVNAYPSKDGVSFFIRNINEIKRSEKVDELEREVLAIYTTKGLSTETALEYLLNGIQKIHPELICNVMMVKDGLLFPWAHSHLPATITTRMHGLPIAGNGIASCIAAFTKSQCTIKDISTTRAYDHFNDLVKFYNLKTCVSYPVLDASEQAIGTFTIYLKSIRDLTADEKKTLEKAGFILRNLLESHLAELAKQKSEEKYKRLFQLNPLPMWVYEQKTFNFLDVNQAALDHYGYSLPEFLKMTIRDLLTAKAQVDFDSMFHQISGAEPIRGVFNHIKKNGEIIYVDSQSNVIQYAGKKARLVLINDITEKIRAKKDLELSEIRFKTLVQKGSDLINVIDQAGNLIYANPSFAILIGVDEEKLIGTNAFEHIHDDDKPLLKRILSLINRKKGVESFTFRLKDMNGNFRYLQSTITNLCHDPAVQGILINSNDITEKIQHINAIEHQNSKLKEIAWIQSHVVRAPLSRILGITNLILEAPDNYNEELLRYLNISAKELDEVVMEIVNRTEAAEKYGN